MLRQTTMSKCFDDEYGGNTRHWRDPRAEPFNPRAERFSRHATLHPDLSVSPQAELYAPLTKEEWRQAASGWNHARPSKSKPARSQVRPSHSSCPEQRTCKVWGRVKQTEVFLRVNDMRERKNDPALKQQQMANLPKRCRSAPPRRLMVETMFKSKPLDSQGGSFTIPTGVDNMNRRSGGARDWRQTQAASMTFHSAKDPPREADFLSTIHPYEGGAPRTAHLTRKATGPRTPHNVQRFYYW